MVDAAEEFNRVLTFSIFSKLEQKWLSKCCSAESSGKTKILCIDGGGVRALMSGRALVYLEEQLVGKTGDSSARIADFFDVVAGTGVGGVLAAMLVCDDGAGRPVFSAEEAVKRVAAICKEVYKKPGGIFRRRRFSDRRFDRLMKTVFVGKDGRYVTLKDSLKPVLIPCYDLRTGAPFVFSRADAAESPSFDFEMWRVARATSATPGEFEPVGIVSTDGRTVCTAVDGSLVMNNPAAAAVTHVLNNKTDFPAVDSVNDLFVLSLGNGSVRKFSGEGRRRWSAGDCSKSVVEIVGEGASETVDQILGNAFWWNRANYVRIQINGFLSDGSLESAIDDVDAVMAAGDAMLEEKGVESVPFGGKQLLGETNKERLDKLVGMLIESWRKLPVSPSKPQHQQSS